ncbi:MAG: hypothetical protein OJF48_001690 [Afipia sp.]|nr:MAG: hypothetical protein OJF48_001690 [Afipia sp.]
MHGKFRSWPLSPPSASILGGLEQAADARVKPGNRESKGIAAMIAEQLAQAVIPRTRPKRPKDRHCERSEAIHS